MTTSGTSRPAPHGEVAALLPLTVMLWLVYLLALALIDVLFYPLPVFPLFYYLLSGANALLVLGLALWRRLRSVLGQTWLPLVIAMMSAAPILIAHLVILPLPPLRARSPEAVTLRLMPILFMALILTAAHYRWRSVLVFSGGVALLTLGANLLAFRSGTQPFVPPLIALLIQTVSFLVVGYFIRLLMQRLQAQQESLAATNNQLKAYATTIEDLTISRERNRMARELHDTLAHTLSALSIQLEAVKACWEPDPAAARRLLDQSLGITRSGLQETRHALKSLRAIPLDDLGLVLALRQLTEGLAQRANLRLELDLLTALPALPRMIEQCLYRVAQEATANVAYHANAHTLTVRLTCNDDVVTLLVADDGHGFEPEYVATAGHFGIAGMRERAELVGGQLRVTSCPQGTTVALVIDPQGKERH